MELVGGAWLLTQVQVPLGCGWAFILRVAKLLLREAPWCFEGLHSSNPEVPNSGPFLERLMVGAQLTTVLTLQMSLTLPFHLIHVLCYEECLLCTDHDTDHTLTVTLIHVLCYEERLLRTEH